MNDDANNKKALKVDQDACIGCTLCTQMCPNVFEMDENGKSKVINPDGDSEEKIQQAIDACPVSCINKF